MKYYYRILAFVLSSALLPAAPLLQAKPPKQAEIKKGRSFLKALLYPSIACALIIAVLLLSKDNSNKENKDLDKKGDDSRDRAGQKHTSKPNDAYQEAIDKECLICFDIHESKDIFTQSCGHACGIECLKSWLAKSGEGCPICRKVFPQDKTRIRGL